MVAQRLLQRQEVEPLLSKNSRTGKLPTGKEITGKKPEIVVKEVESALTPEQLAELEKVVQVLLPQ